jgi:hypothetical protein
MCQHHPVARIVASERGGDDCLAAIGKLESPSLGRSAVPAECTFNLWGLQIWFPFVLSPWAKLDRTIRPSAKTNAVRFFMSEALPFV